MNYLNKILDDEQLDEIVWGYDVSVINSLEDENVEAVVHFLIMNGISFWKEIVVHYLEIFLLDVEDFIEKYRILQQKYPYKFALLEENLDILDEVWD